MPSPATASVALMAMLAFGVLVGSVTATGGAESLANALVVAVAPASHPVTTAASRSGGSGGGGGGGSSGGSSPKPAAAAQAPAQQQTIIAAASPTEPGSTPGGTGSTSSGLLSLPPIKHVFVIMLSDQGYNQAFVERTGHPYLSKTLRDQGELIADYYGVATSPLANEIALLSGQGPTEQTQLNCPVYAAIAPAKKGADAQVLGNGCAYPVATPTLANQLDNAGHRWRAYVQGIEDGGKGQPTTCRHPQLGADDADQAARPGDPYVTWSNPFVYFRSLTNAGQCRKNDVGLNQLANDLKQTSTTPAFSYIAPDPCDDGSDQPCAADAHAGLAAADTFLKSVVPEIERSPSYKQDGLIAITFDEAPQTGTLADSSSCCDQPAFPNLTSSAGASTGTTTTTTTTTPAASTTTATTTTATTTPGATTTTGATTTEAGCPTTTGTGTTTGTTTTGTPATTTGTTTASAPPTPTTTTGTDTTPTAGTGTTTTTTTTTTTSGAASTGCTTTGDSTPPAGGQVGLLLISQYVKPGSLDSVDTFNHFSLLKSVEDLFGLKHLGYATDPALPVFDAAIFNAKAK
jgi:phosphatidylinositol-3-phosphatase